jgi:signal transduction histidine kinase
VDCRLDGDTLVLEVTDDGVGGADPAAGTGLTGLADRLAVVDGTVSLSSPADRGTTLRMEIPCHPSR